MDKYLSAYEIGQRYAVQNQLEKNAGAADLASLVQLLASGVKGTGKGIGRMISGAGEKARDISQGTKYLGIAGDPRKALALGGLAATGGALVPGLVSGIKEGPVAGMLAALPGATAALGSGLAMGANPGLLGGSATNRMTHELSQISSTPAGMISTMAGLVGLPAALIGYGKMKGKEESSLF